MKVYLRKCNDYDNVEKVLLPILENYKDKFNEGDKVLVKPNLLSPKNVETGITTHPKVVEVVLKFLLDLGTKPYLGDSPATGTALEAVKANGIYDVCKKLNVPVVELDDPVDVDGEIYKGIKISKKVLEADKIVNIAKLKTHVQMIMTLAVKNTFGCVVGKEKSAWHFRAKTNTNFANVIIDIHNIVKPTLNIMDGILGMEGNGPANGVQKRFNVIGVSENAYALDHAIIKSLKVKEKYVYIIKEAMKRNLIPHYELESDWEGGKIKLPLTAPIFETVTNLTRAFERVPKINPDKCISCKICESRCPAEAIDIDNDKNIDYSKCIRCYVCHEVCPQDAIKLVRRII
ncbi:DUF362 domain-containing protein [Marinitoga litoralis]|jgi:uncharacterized protein (DUF362 family)|uniref:DUF362 domain-containing protein n=1 Tax=Marinitoga litoralis TaxID=570855 RepID=UPI001960538A|nr:DUF362 domain-containing protein [Marinitoga litoralis]MBM7559586.1 uncharacterized protein (DUF362 family)/ferredoxin [Marinitoga litoralis]